MLYWTKMGLWIKVFVWILAYYFLVLGCSGWEMALGLEHRTRNVHNSVL